MLNQSAFGLEAARPELEIPTTAFDWQNLTAALASGRKQPPASASQHRDPLYIVLPISIIYGAIFVTGLVGNVSTCIVIAKNKFMHTATNYYLFSLAISDLLLLISGLPPEMYYIWSNYPYIFGELFCVIQSFAAETSANATVLTITAFTVERYIAICHPFLTHTMSKLSRAVKFIGVIWFLALGLAIPQAIQFGLMYQRFPNGTLIESSAICTVKPTSIQHAFEMSGVLFFVVPMFVIVILYMLIGLKLKNTRLLSFANRNPAPNYECSDGMRPTRKERNVIRMLVAVVVAFFICWAPFHAQRLLAVYAERNKKDERKRIIVKPFYTALTYVSGIFYYLSTTINPLLYNIMSNKFREAFKAMLSKHCDHRLPRGSPCRLMYSNIARCPRSTTHGGADPQVSASLSISEEMQKLAPSIDCTRKISTNPLMRYNTSSSFTTDKNLNVE